MVEALIVGLSTSIALISVYKAIRALLLKR